MEDGAFAPRAGDRDVSEAALLLEALEAAFVERALRREDAFLPAGQEDGVELQPLGGVDGHDRDLVAAAVLVIVHHQADMLEEAGEVLIFLHRPGELGEVFEAAGGFGAALGLEHRGVAALVEHDPRELGVGKLGRHLPPAGDVADEAAERAAGLRGQLVAVEHLRGGEQQRLLRGAGGGVDGGDRLVAEAALGRLTIRSKARSSAGWWIRRR